MFKYVKTFIGFPSIKNTRYVSQIPNYDDDVVSTRKIYGGDYTIEYTFTSNGSEWVKIYLRGIEDKDLVLFPDGMKVKIDVVIDNYYKSLELIMSATKYHGINAIELEGSPSTGQGMASILNSIEYNLLDFKSIKFELYEDGK